MKHCQIHVKGRVQGVFFRKSTKTIADSLGVKGWVKNLPDGSVLIEAQATEEELYKLIEWCKIGPALAYVDKIEVKELLYESIIFTMFEVLH